MPLDQQPPSTSQGGRGARNRHGNSTTPRRVGFRSPFPGPEGPRRSDTRNKRDERASTVLTSRRRRASGPYGRAERADCSCSSTSRRQLDAASYQQMPLERRTTHADSDAGRRRDVDPPRTYSRERLAGSEPRGRGQASSPILGRSTPAVLKGRGYGGTERARVA